MEPHDSLSGIPERFSGLLAALLRHVLALGALAAEETRLLIRQSVAGIILLTALLLSVTIAYIALVAAAASLLVLRYHWEWPGALGALAIFHLLTAAILFAVFKARSTPPPYGATAAELQRDLEALARHSRTP